MGSLIGSLLVFLPLVISFFKKGLPWLIQKIASLFGKGGLVLSGASFASVVGKLGFFGAIIGLLARIWGWLCRFPIWLKGLFAVGGALHWLRHMLFVMVLFFKSPILIFVSLLSSVIFPTILEKIFLLVGSVSLRIFLTFFKIGKGVFLRSAQEIGNQGGVINEFKNTILGSFDELPSCMLQTMGYVHFIEDLGIIVSTVTLLAIISIFKVVYGHFSYR